MIERSAKCVCGQLRLIASGDPLRVSICHCLDCQRRSGSAFAVQARFPKAAVTLIGESSRYQRIGDEGGKATFQFCPNCGVTLCFVAEGAEDHVAVPVGVFADPTFPAPSVSVYESRMHAWLRLSADIDRLR